MPIASHSYFIIRGSKSAISGKTMTREIATIKAIQKGVTPA
jgi:hypothetical protein